MLDDVFVWLMLEFGLTAVTAAAVLAASWRAAVARASPDAPARFARRSALLLAVIALIGAALQWFLVRDWMHFHWSLTYPMVALFFVSGAFLASTWPNDTRSETTARHGERDHSHHGWWFPAAAVLLALTSIVMLLVLPGHVPPHRTSPGPLLGIVQIAAFGLGFGDLPPVLAVVQPWDEARGMGHLTRDLTVPFGVLTLAARLIIAYVAIAFALRVISNAQLRRTLAFLAPMLATAAAQSVWRPPAYGYWQFEPADIRAFGPTLAAAAFALLAFAAVRVLDRRTARRLLATARWPLPEPYRDALQRPGSGVSRGSADLPPE